MRPLSCRSTWVAAFAALAMVFALAGNAAAQLTLTNGNFDADPDLGGADDPVNPPSGWFTHYTEEQSWSDFRFGNNGNGSWTHHYKTGLIPRLYEQLEYARAHGIQVVIENRCFCGTGWPRGSTRSQCLRMVALATSTTQAR